tara:strand:+ start:6081 stop:15593 length:9513 start_codon:yes stop_codon:yes gene_type:complete
MKKFFKLFLIIFNLSLTNQVNSAILSVTVDSQIQTCPGLSDAKAWVASFTVSPGSTGPYIFRWNVAPTPTQTGDTAFNIGGGSFAVTGIDFSDPNPANNAFTQPFIVASKNVLFVNGFITPESCFGAADGSITAIPGGGTPLVGGPPSYLFNWSPGGNTTQTINSLSAQQYTVTVTDANGCNVDNTFNVGGPTQIQVNLTIDSVDCNGGTAIATIAPAGGTGVYPTVEWSSTGVDAGPSRFVEGGLLGSLAGINYSVTVTDNSGCTQVESFSITEPLTLGATIAPDTINCFGTSTGTAVATVTGGTVPFTFDWPANQGSASNTQGSFSAGSYTVIITDAKGCVLPVNFPIEQRDRLNLQLDSVDVNCNGNLNGQVNGTITGGVAPYSWVANDPAGTMGNTATMTVPNLNGRKVIVTVTDFLNCVRVDSIVVNEPQPLTASFTGITNPSCAGGNNGSINVTFSGGNGSETFTWNGLPFGSVNRTALIAGNYVLVITDIKGCNVTIDTTLVDPIPILGNLTFTPPKCFGGNDGQVVAAPSEGSGVYTNYNFGSQNGINPVLNGVSAGLTTVTITDSDGCTGISSVNVTEPANPFLLDMVADSVNCNGDSTGGATATPSAPLTTGPYTWNWTNSVGVPIGTNDSIIVGLPIGKYFITATDGNGCQILDSVIVEEPNPINSTVIGTNLNCNGDASGSATATISNGNTPYSWSWSTIPLQAGTGPTATAINLDANIKYFLTVIDIKGCSKLDSVTLTEPTAFDLFLDSIRLIKCFGEKNGAIFVSDSGGNAGVGFPTYVWSDDPTTAQDRTDLIASAAAYKIVATDANGCKDSVIQLIPEPNVLDVSIIDTDSASCTGAIDGTATALATGGTIGTGYVYTWSTIPVQNGPNATGLPPGAYTVQVTDSNGCVATSLPFTIFEPINLTTAMTSDSASCAGFNDGSATVTANGGTLNYTYLWDANAGNQITPTATFLLANAPAFYLVTVTDKNGCQKIDSVQLGQPTTLNLSITSQRNVDCAGNFTGEATIGVIGGALPYSFIWENTGNLGTTIGTSATRTRLEADTFRVTVTDRGGCNDNILVIITQPDSLKGSITASLDPSCIGAMDGSATVTATGGRISGTSDYAYSWSTTPTQTTPTATGLEANQLYTVTITDDSLCASTVDVTLTSPNVFVTSDSNVKNVSCFGGNDGFIRLTPAGGTIFPPPANPYSITWTSPPSSFTANGDSIFNLIQGRYIALIQDLNGCIASDTFDLNQPGSNLSLSFDTTDVSCAGSNDGTARVNVVGGSPRYTFDWIGTSFGNVDNISGLTAGTYRVSVTDANGCTTIDSTVINLGTPISLIIDPANLVQDVTCSGAQNGSINLIASGGVGSLGLQWYLLPDRTNQIATNTNSVANLAGGTYRVLAIDGPCSDSLDVIVNEPDTLKAELNKYNINCSLAILGRAAVKNITGGNAGGQSFSWTPDPGVANGGGTDSVLNLTAGNYSVRVFDLFGCDTNINFTISQTVTNFVFTDSLRNDSCIGAGKGYAGIENLSGGVPPYSFEWSTNIGTIVNDAFIDNLTAGNYSVTISDAGAGGCDSVLTIIIDEPDTIRPNAIITNENCNPGGDGSITITPNGGNGGPYTYNWNGPGVIPTGQNQNNLSAGDYFLTITDDLGCTSEDSLNIQIAINIDPNLLVIDVCQVAGLCNGSAQASPTNGTAPYTFEWTSSVGVILVPPTTDSIGRLCNGNYSIKITDDLGCDTTIAFVINGNRTILPNAIVVDESCGGTDDGSISVTPIGGAAPYSYSWLNSVSIDSNRINLAPDNYSITITDATGCFAILDTVVDTDNFDYTISSADLSCLGGNDGTADITIVGGTAGYTFNWTPAPPNGQGTANISNLSVGTYSVAITNTINNCSIAETVDINPNSPINPNEVVSNESCFGQNDGSIVLGVTGGAGNYTYNWSTNVPVGTTGNNAVGLTAGTYTVQIIDAALCDTTITINIISANDILASITENDATCANSAICDGSAVLTVTGVGTFSCAWSPGIVVVGNDSAAINLCPGPYFVDITNANGCVKRVDFIIGGPNPITPNITATDATCNIPDGGLAALPTGGTGILTIEWLDNALASIGTGPVIGSLPAGAYFAVVSDRAGCIDTFPAIINDQGAENISVTTSNNVTCFGGSDGGATVSFNCNNGPCRTEWFALGGISLGAGRIITGLKEGDYYVEVSNGGGCVAIEPLQITQPPPFSISEIVISANCFGGIDGSITLSVSGASGGFNFLWNPSPTNGQGTRAVSGLVAGTYTVDISDVNGCDTTLRFNVQEPIEITSSFVTTNSNCNQSDGQIVATVVGGSTTVPLAYNYQWFDDNNVILVGETTDTLKNVASGTYRLRVRDDNACEKLFSVNLSDLNGPTVNIDSILNAGCFGESNGSVFITASGNNVPFSFNWLPTGAVTEDLANIPAGVYSVRVTDNVGCITIAEDTVKESSEIMATISIAEATCGECNGTAAVSITGGTAPYSYLWSNGAIVNSTDSLCGGNYSLVITDSSGCRKSFDFGVNTTGGPTGETVSISAANCTNSSDGSASVTPVGGTPPYSYLWQHSGATTNTLSNLSAGTYFVQISDVKSCSRTVQIDIASPTKIELNPQTVSSACNQPNGSIILNVTGGQSPYSYNWGTATTADTNFIDGRAAGIYPVSVTDANGCIESFSFGINNSGTTFTPKPTVTDISCFGQCDGSLISNIMNEPVDFKWLDAQRNSLAPLNTDLTNSICAGDYFLEVISNPQGCKSYIPVTIVEPDSITLSSNIIKDISCNGDCDGQVFINTRGGDILYTYSWDDPNNQSQIPAARLCAGNYTVTAIDANGCVATTSITLTDPAPLAVSASNTNLVCSSDCNATAISIVNGGNPPYTYSWSGGQSIANPTDLCFGINVLTVIDARSCSVTDTILVSATDTVIAESIKQSNLCDGDLVNLSGTITGSSITSFGWYLADTTTLLTTALDTSFVRPISSYTYYLIASSGTCSDTARFDVTIAPNPLVNLESEIRRFGDEVTVIELGNEDPSYTYLWNPGTYLDDSTKSEPTTLTEANITYTLIVTDTNGCAFADSILVVYSPDIEVPSGFTPNSDGNNDLWNIQLLEKYPNASVQIYNRWGQLIYDQSNGYADPWDGKYEGKELPIGTYYYIIDLKDSATKPLTGPITILR